MISDWDKIGKDNSNFYENPYLNSYILIWNYNLLNTYIFVVFFFRLLEVNLWSGAHFFSTFLEKNRRVEKASFSAYN